MTLIDKDALSPSQEVEHCAETCTKTSMQSDVETASSIISDEVKQKLTADRDDDTLQENGLRAWLTVFGAFLALFCSFGQMNAFGTFQSWYAAHQLADLQPSTISWIGSIQLWVFFFSVSFPGPFHPQFSAYR